MKTLLFTSLVLFSVTTAFAQTDKTDKKKSNCHFDQKEYPLQILSPDISHSNMPNAASDSESYGYDPKTDKLHYYLNPKTQLFFDFYHKEIRNFKNGEVYQFKKETPDNFYPKEKPDRKIML